MALYRDTLKNFAKPALKTAKEFAVLISGEKLDFQHIEALLQSGETSAFSTRVRAFWSSLRKEESKEPKEQNRASEQQKKLEQAKADLEKMKNLGSVQAKKATAALEKNSKFFKVQDLSEESREKIQLASLGDSGCSRCRYLSSGCLSCSGFKALSFFIKSEAFKKDKVPKWSGLFLRCRLRIQLL